MAVTTLFSAHAKAAEPVQARIDAALRSYADGKAVTSRNQLVRLLKAHDVKDAASRLPALQALLDICIHSYDERCLSDYAREFIELSGEVPVRNEVVGVVRAWRAAYYLDYVRFWMRQRETTRVILDGPSWKREASFSPELYLERQALAANILLELDRPDDALAAVDRTLSMIASLQNPEQNRFRVASGLLDAIRTLLALGQTERAFGLYRVGGGFLAGALPAKSIDAGVFRLTEGELLQQVGDLDGSRRALDQAAVIFSEAELNGDVRAWLLGRTLSLRAAVCAMRGDMACARDSLERHPLAQAFGRGGREPESLDDVAYLAARGLISALDGASDPASASALAKPINLKVDMGAAAQVEVYRAAGRALALPPGPERRQAIADVGRGFQDMATRRRLSAGAWYRPGAVDRLILTIGLAGVGEPEAAEQADTHFALFQLSARAAPSYEGDAATALSRASSELQRRSVHEALRLRARRDRLERIQIQSVFTRAMRGVAQSGSLTHDVTLRRRFGDYADRINRAQAAIRAGGIELSGANTAPLKAFQAGLARDEAALFVTLRPGGLSYLCVRRDAVSEASQAADLQRLILDVRLLQSALTATHAPSAALDAQFPAEAAVRAYDVLLRPFEGCLKDNDRILWMPGVAGISGGGLPLSMLLRQAPPRRDRGYDLAAADWLVRRHAVSYPLSAAAVAASRRAPQNGVPPFGLLGVGDPLLTGTLADGQARGQAVLRGVRSGSGVTTLPPLPDTRDELIDSSRPFAASQLLLGAEATERGFRSELVGAYRYLSFATHGLVRDDLQGLAEPALVLTPVSASDPGDDGLLTASEIADLNLQARFVALSACNTANFDLSQIGQDLQALASAFAVAGTPSTLATLWPVNSETGRRVVAWTFEGVGASGAAQALADAQRRFLAAPPSAAYLHPRFWAPFVVLGEGGVASGEGAAGTPVLKSVDVLTRDGGEVLSVRRSDDGILARFISDKDATGRHASSVRFEAARGRSWRTDTREEGALSFTAVLGGTVLTAGYEYRPDGRLAPRLTAQDRRTGAILKTWAGTDLSEGAPTIFAGLVLGSDQVGVLMVDAIPETDQKAKLRLLTTGRALEPKLLFEIVTPSEAIHEATILAVGEDLILTYSDAFSGQPSAKPMPWDDFEAFCYGLSSTTWIERRDRRTGALKARRTAPGVVVTTALNQGGQVYLGGSIAPECRLETQAAVWTLSPDLQLGGLFVDAGLGRSQVRSLSLLPDGRLFTAASKEARVDIRPAETPAAEGFEDRDFTVLHAGMVFILGPDGAATPVRMLDAGADVYVDGADASRPDDILLGGSVGGRAAIFRIATPAGATTP